MRPAVRSSDRRCRRLLGERLLGRAAGSDTGSMAPLVPIVVLVLLLLAGLVIDASRLLNARGRAVAYAEEAARAGAAEIDQDSFAVRLDEPAALDRVEAFCAQTLASDATVQRCEPVGIEAVSDEDPRRIAIRVQVDTTIATTLLGIIGLTEMDASGEARARPVEGTSADDIDAEEPEVIVPEGVSPDPDEDVAGPGGAPQGEVPDCNPGNAAVVPPFCEPPPIPCGADGADPIPPFCGGPPDPVPPPGGGPGNPDPGNADPGNPDPGDPANPDPGNPDPAVPGPVDPDPGNG